MPTITAPGCTCQDVPTATSEPRPYGHRPSCQFGMWLADQAELPDPDRLCGPRVAEWLRRKATFSSALAQSTLRMHMENGDLSGLLRELAREADKTTFGEAA
jgi:hypothetical protein